MRLNQKVGVLGIVAALLVSFAVFGLGGNSARAEVTGGNNGVWVVSEQGIDPAPGATIPQEDCAKAAGAKQVTTANFPPANSLDPLPLIILSTSSSIGNSVILCVNADDGDGQVTFDANNSTDVGATGAFTRPSCGFATVNGSGPVDGDSRVAEWPDDPCQDPSGVGTGHLVINDSVAQCINSTGTCNNDTDNIMVVYTCPSVLSTILVTIGQDQSQVQFRIQCRPQAGGITLTATPSTVEIVPAPSNTAHSLIQLTATDSSGNNILIKPGTEVDFTVNQGTLLGTGPLGNCAIESSGVDSASGLLAAQAAVRNLTTAQPLTYVAWDDLANEAESGFPVSGTLLDLTPGVDSTKTFDIEVATTVVRSMAAAILHCDVHAGVTSPTPGIVTVQACLDIVGAADLCKTVQVTVIGPPASVTVAASPTAVRCGEKSTITVTVKDAVGQNVSDHTVVELVSNLGGTIGGTGAVAGFAGPVVPVSSSVAGTFGGVATAFLLTSDTHEGPYEVVATTGGTEPQVALNVFNFGLDEGVDVSDLSIRQTVLGGIFSTPPISAQVTVTCTIPAAAPTAAPSVTAPRTGTGVTPPNTGDAGLLGSKDSSGMALFAIGGLVAFALAGLATLKFARR